MYQLFQLNLEQFPGSMYFRGFAETIKQGEFEVIKTDLENLSGRKPKTAKQYLAEVYTS